MVGTDESSKLREVAAARASILGRSADDVYGDILTAIHRTLPLILDNLRFPPVSDEVIVAYANALGKREVDLTDEEKGEIFLHHIISAPA